MLNNLKAMKIKTLVLVAVGALSLVSLAESGLAFFNYAQADQARRTWQIDYELSAQESRILASLRGELGYGGFIHDFKNYVLRKDSDLLADSRQHLVRSGELLDELSGLDSLPGHIASIKNIRIALEKYSHALETAEQMVVKGMASQLIDAAVKVEDGAALSALNKFDDQLEENRKSTAFAVGSILSSHSGITATANIAGTLLLIMLCVLLIVVLQSRVLMPLGRLRKVMAGIAQGDFTSPLTEAERDDEIGEMARSLQIFRDDAEELEDLRAQHFEVEKNSINEEAQSLVDISRRLVAEEKKQREKLASEIGRKAAELKRSEALAKGLLDTVRDAFVSADASGDILSFNRAAEEMFGYSAVDVIGKRVNMLMPQDIAAAHDQFLADSKVRDTPITMGPDREVIARRKDGSEFPVFITVMALPDDSGDIFVATICDVTDEHRALEKIQRLGRLVDRSHRAVFTLNAESYAIQEVNKRAEEVFGYSAEEFLTLGYEDLIDGKSLDDIREYVMPMIAGDIDEITIEARHRRKDGSTYPMEAQVHYWTEEDTPVFLVVARDITDRLKAREELLKAKENAETASRAKSAFLANMSHDLRTPLNAVIGYSELLLEDVEADGNDQYMPDLQLVCGAGEHLLTLINDVLDLSKIEAGRAEIVIRETDVFAVMHEICALVRPQAEANCNTVTLEVDEDLKVMWSDETRVKQIIANLMSNAAKFTQDGTISLSASSAQISGEDYVLFTVTDSGIGIPEDQLDGVFDEFSQVGGGNADKPQGTGLGLAICKRLVQLMQGDIRISSIVGQGTSVTLWLPVDMRPVFNGDAILSDGADAGPTTGGVAPSDVARILVIEDNDSLRDLMEQFLEREAYEVATACCGVEGLQMVEELRPQIVLLDINLPDLDGREVYRSIRSRYTRDQVKIIFCTGNDGVPVNEIFMENQYVTKPVKRDELLEALRNCA